MLKVYIALYSPILAYSYTDSDFRFDDVKVWTVVQSEPTFSTVQILTFAPGEWQISQCESPDVTLAWEDRDDPQAHRVVWWRTSGVFQLRGESSWTYPTASERDRGVGSPVMWPWSVGLTKAWGVVKYTVFCDQSLSSSRSTTWSSHLHPTFSWSFVVVPVRTHFQPETSAGSEFLSLLSFQLIVGVDQDLQVQDNSFICSSWL